MEAALILLHPLLPQPRARMLYYVAEEGEGREGMAHEALFLKKSLKHTYKTIWSCKQHQQVQKSFLEGKGVLEALIKFS